MLKLKELRFSGIGRFVDEQVIDFTKLGNLVQVDAKNNNTGGSSGSGKTTVFNALDFLLGLNDVPNSVLQSRLTKDSIDVTGIFDYDGKPLKIQRNKKLSIDLDGEVTSGSAKISEEKLDSILAMPRHLFRAMLHKRQKEGGFFLQLTPKETHEFLMDCLGLAELRKKLEIVEKKVTELTNLKTSVLSQIESAKAAQSATQSAIIALGQPPVKEVNQEVILALKTKMEASQANLAALQAKHKLELEQLELSRPTLRDTTPDTSKRLELEEKKRALQARDRELMDQHSKLVQAEMQRVATVNAEISKIQLKMAELRNNVRVGDQIKKEAARVALEIKKIRESICPTCEQGWVTDTAKAKEAELLAKIEEYKRLIALGAQSSQELIRLEGEIGSLMLQNTQKHIEQSPEIVEVGRAIKEIDTAIAIEMMRERDYTNSQNHINRVALQAFSEEQTKIKVRQDAEVNQARGQLDIDRRTFETAVSKLKAYEEARVRYESSLKTLLAQEEQYIQKVNDLNMQWSQIDGELMVADELRRAIKSYTSCSFDDALEYISDAATKIIRNIPNMANATIQLEGIRETNAGKVKEEVNAVINMDGEMAVPIKSLSGGERSSVDLAVDLAVIDLLENKTGKGIDIFILDEPFTGLDTVSIEMALEVLKNSNLSKRLVIVDHNPEVKQMVESRLIVVRDGATSKVLQQ